MADPAKLRQIVAKLEAKLKPMHDEIDSLRERLELATLDKELAEEQVAVLQSELASLSEQLAAAHSQLDEAHASDAIIEQLTQQNLGLSARVTELGQRVADLELLKDLSDELEETHVQREKELNEHVAALESQLVVVSNRLRAAERQTTDLQRALAEPAAESSAPAPIDVLALEQRLEVALLDLQHSRLDLRACKLDLQVATSGLYATLAAETKNKVFYKLKLLAAAQPHLDEAVQALFDRYKQQNIPADKLEEQAVLLADQPWPDLASFWPQALQYLSDMGAPAFEGTPDLASLAAALESPDKPVQRAEIKLVESEPPARERPDDMQIKIQLLESKVAKARDLATHISRLEGEVAGAAQEAARLTAVADAQTAELRDKAEEIERLKARPVSLDSATLTARVASLNATVAFLAARPPPPLRLAPLDHRPRLLSGLAGHPALRELTSLAGQFAVRDISPQWRPRAEKPGWAAAEQARALALVTEMARATCGPGRSCLPARKS